MVTIIFLISTVLLMLIVRPITVLVHELGHAIPALIFSSSDVKVYIGSYGDPKQGIVIKLSRLTIFFKYNPILWNYGLCAHSNGNNSFPKQFLITLLGPLISLFFGFTTCYLFFSNFEEGIFLFIGVIILSSSLLDFYINIKPDNRGVKLHDGTIAYNDGQKLLNLIQYRTLLKKYDVANKLYDKKEYLKAGLLYQKLVEEGNKYHSVFLYAVNSFMLVNEFQIAKNLIVNYSHNFPEDDNTITNLGICYFQLGENKKSTEMYNKALTINPDNINTLNNRGYQKNVNKEFKEAIPDFNKAIKIDPNFAYALNNRGHARIELGLEKEGFNDIKKSIEIDKNNPFAYRNLGIYYIRKKDRIKALENLELALKLKPETHLIQDLLAEARNI